MTTPHPESNETGRRESKVVETSEYHNFAAVPDQLKARPQWVCWRWEERDGKPTKVPYTPLTGRKAKADAPRTWNTYGQALNRLEHASGYAGIGYEFAKDDEYAGIDFDDCLDPETGEITKDWVHEAIQQLNSYTEISPSGLGLKTWVKAKLPGGGHNDQKNGREMYDHGRFFTTTGKHFPGTPTTIEERQAEVEALYNKWWPSNSETDTQPRRSAGEASAGLPLSDFELIEKARNASNGRKFEALWNGDTSRYGNDHSAADQALCDLLAFWTDRDPERMDRLFRLSRLMRREKWDAKHYSDGRTYGQGTIDKAIESTREGYTGQIHKPNGGAIPPEYEHYAQGGEDIDFEQPPPDIETEPERQKQRFRFVMVGELVTQAKAPEWQIKGVIERNTLIHVFGDSASGKSLVEIDKACCIAAGIPWHGHKVKQGMVIYLAGEGHGGLSRRFLAWSKHNGIDMSAMPLAVSTQAATLCDAEGAIEVAQAIDAIVEATRQKPAYIVIDTLARNFGGDENASKDMNEFILNVDIYLRARYEAAVCLVHHSGHGDKDRGRGSSALRAAIDTEFKVCQMQGVITVEQKKSKDSRKHEPMYFKTELVNIGLADEDGEPVDSVVIVQAEGPPPEPKNKGLGKHQKTMLDKLRELYDLAKQNLAGKDDATPRVALEWWLDQCRAADIPKNRLSEGKAQLLDRKLIRLDGLFVYLTDSNETDNE